MNENEWYTRYLIEYLRYFFFCNTNLADCNAVWYNVEEVRLLLMMAPFVGGVSPLFWRIPWGGAVISVKPSPNICCSSSHFCGTKSQMISMLQKLVFQLLLFEQICRTLILFDIGTLKPIYFWKFLFVLLRERTIQLPFVLLIQLNVIALLNWFVFGFGLTNMFSNWN